MDRAIAHLPGGSTFPRSRRDARSGSNRSVFIHGQPLVRSGSGTISARRNARHCFAVARRILVVLRRRSLAQSLFFAVIPIAHGAVAASIPRTQHLLAAARVDRDRLFAFQGRRCSGAAPGIPPDRARRNH